MKKWVIGAALLAVVSFNASAELPDLSKVRQVGNMTPVNGQAVQLGSWLADHSVHITKASYSVLKDGSVLAGTTLAMRGVDGKAAVVPSGAIIKNVWVDVLIPLAGTSGVTAGIGVNAASDTWPSQPLANLGSAVAVKSGQQSSVLPMKLTAKKNVSLAIGTGHLTTGKFNVLVEYYLSDPL